MRRKKQVDRKNDCLRKYKRRLIIVDIENVGGTSRVTERSAMKARLELYRALNQQANDHVVVGTSHPRNMISSSYIWEGARQVFHHGHNGADLALLEVLKENVSSRFTEVVIASGDGIFAEVADELGREGVCVTVVARAEALSYRLMRASSRTLVYSKAGTIIPLNTANRKVA